MAVKPPAPGVEEDRPVEPFPDGQVDGWGGAGASGMVTTLPAPATHRQAAVATLEAEDIDFGAPNQIIDIGTLS